MNPLESLCLLVTVGLAAVGVVHLLRWLLTRE